MTLAVVGCEAFREVDGLSGAAGGEQPAEVNLPDGERIEQDFVRCRGFQGLDALPGYCVEQVWLSGLGGGPGEQDQPCSVAGRVVIDLQGLPQPDDARSDVAGLAWFSASAAEAVPLLRAEIASHGQTFRLGAGEGVLLSNTRWLHGRDHYAGDRTVLRVLGDPLPSTAIMPGFPAPSPSTQTPRAA